MIIILKMKKIKFKELIILYLKSYLFLISEVAAKEGELLIELILLQINKATNQ